MALTRRTFWGALLCAPLLFLASQGEAARPRKRPPPSPEPPAQLPDIVHVDINTELGTITVALDAKHAPVTSRNFLRYTVKRRFDGMAFYRAMRLNWGDTPAGLIQTGLSGNPLKVLAPIAHEPTSQTGLSHKAGALSMARFAPGTATADFSIMISDMTGLDAKPDATDAESRAGYAVFGHVVAGMDVARKIFDAPTSPTLGQGVMRGQMLEPQIKVLSVRISTDQPLQPAPETATQPAMVEPVPAPLAP